MTYTIILLLSMLFSNRSQPGPQETAAPAREAEMDSTLFTVMQMNVWQEGTRVENGYEGIVDEIARYQPDFVSINEIRNYNEVDFLAKLCNSLEDRGVKYYANRSQGSGIISRHAILEFSTTGDIHSMHKIVSKIGEHEIAFYTAHLDYRHYAEYLPRGYDGSGNKLSSGSVIDVAQILIEDSRSTRAQAIEDFLQHQKTDVDQHRFIILAGDFNEASHLDWTERTRHLYNRNGVVVPWPTSTKLYDHNYRDSYRAIHPNELTHPGFTWVVNEPWIKDKDERERIDFIYYKENEKIKPINSYLIGPDNIYIGDSLSPESGKDEILLPQSQWPSDHRAVITQFVIK